MEIVGKKNPFTIYSPDMVPETEMQHSVWCLTTRGSAQYAIDIAGAQVGYHAPVMPWKEFRTHRVEYLTNLGYFGSERKSMSVKYREPLGRMCPEPAREAIRVNGHTVAKSMDEAVSKWLASKQISPAKMLRTSKQRSRTLMQEMIADISTSIKDFVSIARQSKQLIVRVRVVDKDNKDPEKRVLYIRGDESASYSAYD